MNFVAMQTSNVTNGSLRNDVFFYERAKHVTHKPMLLSFLSTSLAFLLQIV